MGETTDVTPIFLHPRDETTGVTPIITSPGVISQIKLTPGYVNIINEKAPGKFLMDNS